MTLDQVDPDFIHMLVAYEDKRFFTHHGVDPLAVARADGSERRILDLDTELNGRIDFGLPAWRPDGGRLIVQVDDDAGERLLTADADGSNVAFVDFVQSISELD